MGVNRIAKKRASSRATHMVTLGSGTNLWQLSKPKFVEAQQAGLKRKRLKHELVADHLTLD